VSRSSLNILLFSLRATTNEPNIDSGIDGETTTGVVGAGID
jgi:hypothetical protein